MSLGINTTPYTLSGYQPCVKAEGASFSEKSAVFEKLTGLKVDESTPFVMSKESQVRLGNMGEFFRVSCNSTGSHAALVEDTARKYVELRDEILEQYKDDEAQMYDRLSELNQSFEMALSNTCLMPMYTPNYEIRVSYTEEERIRNEAELAAQSSRAKNVQDVMQNFHDNMARHMDTFFVDFIKNIQTNDFETAFSKSMSLLESSETKSFSEISYNDMLRIKDVINSLSAIPTEYDGDGNPTKYRQGTADELFRELVADERISYTVRESIAERFNFHIEAQ